MASLAYADSLSVPPGGGNEEEGGRSLVSSGQEWPRKKRRAYQRAMSGVEIAKAKGEFIRKIELTSSPTSPPDIHRSFRIWVKRVRRKFETFEYMGVKEFNQNGLVHLHALYRGKWIPQTWLSKAWEDIHRAKIVWIRLIKASRIKDRAFSCAYVVKYCQKIGQRYWMSYRWVFQGFVRKWNELVGIYGNGALRIWKSFLTAFARGYDVILPPRWDPGMGIQTLLRPPGYQIPPRRRGPFHHFGFGTANLFAAKGYTPLTSFR